MDGFKGATIPAGAAFLLKVRDLAKRFDHRPVFENVAFEVPLGRVLVVTGRNGAGKSTLLRILAGLSRPTRGTVEFHAGGTILDAAARRRVTGYLAPDLSLYDELSPEENLIILGRIRGLDGDLRARARDLLDKVGLSANGEPSGTLSTGQRQRVKIALALLGDPGFLLLDEPGTNLDAEGRRVLEGIVTEARSRGPVIIATNDQEEVRLGDQNHQLEKLAVANGRRP